MKQHTIFTDRPAEFLEFARSLADTPEYRYASERLLLIFSQEPADPHRQREVAAIGAALPGLKILGLTMADFPLPPQKEQLKTGAVYSLLLFERSWADLYSYNCREVSEEEAGRRFRRELRYKEHVAGVLVFTAGIVKGVDRFLSALSRESRQTVPVLGVEAGAEGVPHIFGSFGGYDRGLAVLVFRGSSLHMQYNYDMGWQPIGKDMHITGMEGDYCVSTIDGEPAASIYRKYLGVEPDEFFVENVREFPLVTDRGERKVVRCPSGWDDRGRLHFIAKLNEGDTVRLSYANPRRLQEGTRLYAGAMKEFDPQGLLLVICENRARFLGRETYNDIGSYAAFCPQTAWSRGHAAILLDSQGGGVVNSAILALGLREGVQRGGTGALPVQPAALRKGAIPLNERLAMFLEQTTKELEDMAIAAGAANAAKSSFLSSMSHEIRTPINAILGMNEMILRESGEEAIRGYAENISIAGMSLLNIISDILDFSKIEAGKMELAPDAYEVPSLVSDLVNLIWLRAEEKGLAMEVQVDPRTPHILYGDEMRLKQVITNLLSNAVKYTERGTIWFTLGCEQYTEEEVVLHVSVRDTGYGIPAEKLNRLFNAFDRIDAERTSKIEGTGLGLNISQQLLAMMGSRLEVESVYGQGSTFSFRLVQRVVEWEEIGDRGAAPHGERRRKNRNPERFVAPEARILVVDDAPMNLAVISGLLKRTQVQVDTADGGLRCIELLGERDYDLVFLDHRMPVMDGVETLQRLRELYPEKLARTPVVCLTANAVAGAREQYMEAGFNDYLTKPVMADQLERMILHYLPPEKVLLETSAALPEALALPSWLLGIRNLNASQGLGFCGGAEEYLSALGIFASSIPEKSAEIEQAFAAEDWPAYTIRVHALKSMARSVGAGVLSGLAEELEAAGDRGDTEAIRAHTPRLLELYRELADPLSPLTEPAAEAEERPEIAPEELQEALTALRELAGSFDYENVRMVMEELEQYRPPAGQEALFARLAEAVRKPDWEQLSAVLDEMTGNEE